MVEEYTPFCLIPQKMEVDVYIPSLGLAFEYHGVQHYEVTDQFRFSESLDTYNARDIKKKKICEEAGITLVSIPHWWDLTESSLRATIFREIPNIIPDPKCAAIPAIPIPKKSGGNEKSKEALFLILFSSLSNSIFTYLLKMEGEPRSKWVVDF